MSDKDIRKALVSENEPVPESVMVRAIDLGTRIKIAVAQRRHIVATRGLDPAFCIPAANWAEDAANDYVGAYRLLSTLAPGSD
jgi:hypothetical protein